MLARNDQREEAVKRYDEMSTAARAAGYTLTAKTERFVSDFQTGDSMTTPISRRSALTLLSSAGIALGLLGEARLLFTDELLTLYADGLKTCWELYFSGNTGQVIALLPLYRGQISALAKSASPLQQAAAQLASPTTCAMSLLRVYPPRRYSPCPGSSFMPYEGKTQEHGEVW